VSLKDSQHCCLGVKFVQRLKYCILAREFQYVLKYKEQLLSQTNKVSAETVIPGQLYFIQDGSRSVWSSSCCFQIDSKKEKSDLKKIIHEQSKKLKKWEVAWSTWTIEDHLALNISHENSQHCFLGSTFVQHFRLRGISDTSWSTRNNYCRKRGRVSAETILLYPTEAARSEAPSCCFHMDPKKEKSDLKKEKK